MSMELSILQMKKWLGLIYTFVLLLPQITHRFKCELCPLNNNYSAYLCNEDNRWAGKETSLSTTSQTLAQSELKYQSPLSTSGSFMGASRSFYVPALTPRGLFRFAMFIFFILFCRQYLEDYFANRLTTQYSFSLLSDVMSAGEVKISLSICVPYGMSRTMEVTDIDEKLKVLE